MKKIIAKIVVCAVLGTSMITPVHAHYMPQTRPGRFALASGLVGAGSLAGAAYLHKKEKHKRLRNLLYLLSALGVGGAAFGTERAHHGMFSTPNFKPEYVKVDSGAMGDRGASKDERVHGVFQTKQYLSPWGFGKYGDENVSVRTDSPEGLREAVMSNVRGSHDQNHAVWACRKLSTDPQFVGAGCILRRFATKQDGVYGVAVHPFKSEHSVQYGVKQGAMVPLQGEAFVTGDYDFVVSVASATPLRLNNENDTALFGWLKDLRGGSEASRKVSDERLAQLEKHAAQALTLSTTAKSVIITRTYVE